MPSLEKLGSNKHPIRISVWDEEAVEPVARLCEQNGWKFVAKIDPEEDEDLEEFILKLRYEQSKNTTQSPAKANLDPKPNNYCPCNSGNKFKKCCMLKELPPTASA
jgi:uncharacterized protein YecA (UPF0149 family)